MKKIFTTALLVMLGAGAYAQTAPQTSQGNMVVSGSVSLSNETTTSDSYTNGGKNIHRSIFLSPAIGYFVNDGLEIGAGIGLSQYKSISKWDEGKNYSIGQSISIRPYVRKYVPITEQLQLHGSGFVSFGIGNTKSKSNNDSSAKVQSTSTDLGIGLYPGLTYFATQKLGFSATFGSISFSRSKVKPKESYSNSSPEIRNSFTADLSPSSVSIGISYFIAR